MLTTTKDTFEDRLIPMLRVAVEESGTRRRPQSHRPALIAAVAALVVTFLVLGGLAIGRTETLILDGREALRDPASLVVELSEAGIDARIWPVPIDTQSPKGVGEWVDVAFDRPDPLSSWAWGALTWTGPVLRLPKGIEGTVSLFVGRPAHPGESSNPGYSANALAPTGDFWCLALETMSPADATTRLEELGYEVRWEWREPTDSQGIGDAWSIDELPASAVLVRASRTGPDLVWFNLMASRYAEEERNNWGTPTEAVPRSTWEAWAPPCG